MTKSNNMGKKIAAGAVIAGVAGFVAGILTAPKSGKETRADIKNKALDIKEQSAEKLQELHDQLKSLLEESKVRTLALSSKAREEFNEAILRAKDAQAKAATVLKAFKAGQADDPELNKAVKQAELARKNLAKFLKS